MSPFVWFLHYPMWPTNWGVLLAGSLAAALLVHWLFWICVTVFLMFNILYWVRVRDHFRHGDTNPGVIVSVDPMLIAVRTDLAKRPGCEFPVVKIVRARLSSCCGRQPVVGARVGTVSLYADLDPKLPYWGDFHPRPVDCATEDEQRIRNVVESIPKESWDVLVGALADVPKPFRKGLYRLWEDQPAPDLTEL